jgi:phage shock protein PspC (stress-responsive transcriptional regulator)
MDETTGARNTPGSPSPTEDTTPTPSLADDTAREQPTDQLPAPEPAAAEPAAAEPAAEQSVAGQPVGEQAAAESDEPAAPAAAAEPAYAPFAASAPSYPALRPADGTPAYGTPAYGTPAYGTPAYAAQPAFTPPPPDTDTPSARTARPPIRLRRSRDERMIAGVCGGLAQVLGVDVVILRLALVLATVLGVGAGVILYLACWILMPVVPENESMHIAEHDPAPSYPAS